MDDANIEPQDELANLDDDLDELTEDDKAYFESGGATEGEAVELGADDISQRSDEDGRQRTVPHGALHAEREEHKKTKQALADLKEKFSRSDERLQTLTELALGRIETAEEVPDPEEDLPGYVAHLEDRVVQAQESSDSVARMLSEQAVRGQVESAYVADAQRFVSERPDFGDAYHFLVGVRAGEYEAAGVTDPSEIARRVQGEEMALVRDALSAGTSPSERIYELAVMRGYAANGTSQGQAKLRSLQRAQDANRSLSSVSGAAGGVLTAEALAEMSEEDFQEVYERLKKEDPKQLQALMM